MDILGLPMEGEVEISKSLNSKGKKVDDLQFCSRDVICLQLDQSLQELSPRNYWPAAAGEGNSASRN